MWLRDFLPVDIPNIRVMIYGYPSKLQGSTSRARLHDYTTSFLEALQSARNTAEVNQTYEMILRTWVKDN